MTLQTDAARMARHMTDLLDRQGTGKKVGQYNGLIDLLYGHGPSDGNPVYPSDVIEMWRSARDLLACIAAGEPSRVPSGTGWPS
jgi:hypothetical protein